MCRGGNGAVLYYTSYRDFGGIKFGMVTVGINPTDLKLNPIKIPLGGVVQN